jgi:hypothetical protein
MNKTDAAKFLGISPRTLIRLVNKGELAKPTYNNPLGATAPVVDYDKKDLERYKKQTANRTVERPTPAPANATAMQAAPNEAALALFTEMLSQTVTRAIEAAQSRAPVVSTATLTGQAALSLDQAVAVTHYPKTILRRAINAGTLKANKFGNGYNIRCAELDTFISTYKYEAPPAKTTRTKKQK